MKRNKLTIGLFGFGCVGQGLYDVLHKSGDIPATIKTICVKTPGKTRPAHDSAITFSKADILEDPEINLVIELINDADEAFEIVSEAARRGKWVITANKKMLAEHFDALQQLQHETGKQILYEGAVCAAIPIIRTLEEYYDNDLLSAIEGIFNGTTNYILTKTMNENRSYADVLAEAQLKGYAEANPTLDVEGYDAKYKLVILAAHAFGIVLKPEQVLNLGIRQLSIHDINFANEKGYRIKLVPHLRKRGNVVTGYVLPQFVGAADSLYHVNNEFNAVSVQAAFADKQFFSGRGAGSHPTGAAVLSDISALTYDYKYGYKKLRQADELTFSNAVSIRAYIRFEEKSILDELGVGFIEEMYIGKAFGYVIAEVSVENLLKINLNSRRGVFVIKLGEVEPLGNQQTADAILEGLNASLVEQES